MTLGDLVPWSRKDRDVALQRSDRRDAEGSELSSFLSLHREMNRLFDEALRDFGLFGGGRMSQGWPHLELTETEDGYKLTAELPGMDEKDIELSLQDGVLTLRGEKKAEQADEQRGYSERYYGAFSRSITVGEVDESKVNATFDRGVLTVTLPRSREAESRVKRIAIGGDTKH
jgi:HSP20 family protein